MDILEFLLEQKRKGLPLNVGQAMSELDIWNEGDLKVANSFRTEWEKKNKTMTRQEILNEILDDVRKYRNYLVYKSRKRPRHIAPKFNYWDMRDSIEETLKKFGNEF